jgi:hypothetical protein
VLAACVRFRQYGRGLTVRSRTDSNDEAVEGLERETSLELAISRSEKNNSSPDLPRYQSIPIIDPVALTNEENSYSGTESVVLAKVIEPSSKAWEAFVLPLNYTRMGVHFTQVLQRRENVREFCGSSNGLTAFL